jgi:CheY-like chemotaxis protein
MEQPSHLPFLAANPGKKRDFADGQSARVLVIDDEPGIRRFLRASLAARGYELYEAATGHDGMQAVPIHHTDIVILDLGLPDIDGLDVIRSLREWTQTPILYTVGSGTGIGQDHGTRRRRGRLSDEAIRSRRISGAHSRGIAASPRPRHWRGFHSR